MPYKNITTIYLDMDGVLTEFDAVVDKLSLRKPNGKVNWQELHKLGSAFWSDMPWREDGKIFYAKVLEFCKSHNLQLGILSAIYSKTGIYGKKEWLKKNCPEINDADIIICDKGVNKYLHLPENGLLIDDNSLNCVLCNNALHYDDCETTIKYLETLFT